MRQNFWCLLFLIVCLSAVLVKSQSFSEVDEDGNEIEVKRFYIEGRQLNGGRRQCVETRRRKRAYNYGQSDDNANDELPMSSGTAATGIDTAVSLDEEDADKNEEPIGLIGLYNNTNANVEQSMAENNEADEDADEREEEAVLSLPVIAQITHPNGEQSSMGAAATNNNGIVIVHTNKPPKVNPQTHAVFELRPVQREDDDNAGDDDDNYDEDDDENSNLLYQEEISPVSTTAIWSTGEDDLGNLYDDYKDGNENNEESGEDGTTAKPKPKPKPKPPKKPSKRPSKRPSKKSSKNRNKKKNKKSTNSKHRRPGNKNKYVPGKRGMGNNKRRRQRPNNLNNSNRGQQNNLHALNQGTNTFSKTETLTRTGTPNDEKDVNCIIINKTTTTPRPFWGLLGRNADGGELAPTERPYGRRKRINFSIPA